MNIKLWNKWETNILLYTLANSDDSSAKGGNITNNENINKKWTIYI